MSISMSVAELGILYESSSVPTLIDVRDADEFASDHLPGSINIPLTELSTAFSDIDRASSVIFICQTGVRSAQAATFAKSVGYTNVRSLDGGMVAWSTQFMPKE